MSSFENEARDTNINTKKFVVYPSKLLFWVGIGLVALAVMSAAAFLLDSSEDMDARVGWVCCAIIVCISIACFLYYKKWRIDVNGSVMTVTTMFGKEKISSFKDITKVRDVKNINMRYINVSQGVGATINVPGSVTVYINNKKGFEVLTNCVGFGLLVQRLKEERIPFVTSKF